MKQNLIILSNSIGTSKIKSQKLKIEGWASMSDECEENDKGYNPLWWSHHFGYLWIT